MMHQHKRVRATLTQNQLKVIIRDKRIMVAGGEYNHKVHHKISLEMLPTQKGE